jgi:hypothetical protein
LCASVFFRCGFIWDKSKGNRTEDFLANVVNRQPASFQFAYDLEVVNFQDVEISMIRRDLWTSQCPNGNPSEEVDAIQMFSTLNGTIPLGYGYKAVISSYA